MNPPRCTCTPGSTDGGIVQDPEWDLDCPIHAAAIEAEFGSQPPCTCGEQATGLVVEGHLHPYCAWEASEERAAAAENRALRLLCYVNSIDEQVRRRRVPAETVLAKIDGLVTEALAADREGSS